MSKQKNQTINQSGYHGVGAGAGVGSGETVAKKYSTPTNMYTKLVIHYKGRDIEFQAHEVVLLAQNVIENYAFPEDIASQVFMPKFWQWFLLLKYMDENTPVTHIINGALDPFITMPMHIRNIDSLPKWLYVNQALNRRYENERGSILGTWIDVSGYLVRVSNAEEMTYYVSDHGKLEDIIATVRDLAFGTIDWAEPSIMPILAEVLKKLEEMTPKEREEFEKEFAESIEGDSVENARRHYSADWSDEDIRENIKIMAKDAARTMLHMDEANRYLIHVLLKKYMQMKFLDKPNFDNEIYYNFEVYDRSSGEPIRESRSSNGVQKTWEERLVDAKRYIKTMVLEHVALDVNRGEQEQLFRPVHTFGGREKGPTYHEFRDAVTEYMRLPAHLAETEIAAGIRRMLNGEVLDPEKYPSFLPSLFAAWFLAEPTRNPTSFLSGLMLLDMIESNVELLDGVGHNWYSLANTLVHPLKDSGVGTVIDLYGSNTKGIDRFGGMHPMAHDGSVSQGKAEIKDRHKLTTVRQKEASLLFHWLSICLESMGIECRLISDNEEYLDKEDVVGVDEIGLLGDKIAAVRKKIAKRQKTIELKRKRGESASKQENELERFKTQESELLDAMIKAELKYDLISPLIMARLSTIDNLLEEQKPISKKYVKISRYLEADELGTLMRLKIHQSYPDQEVVEILPIDLDGNCMYNAILQGLLRLPASYIENRFITLEGLRNRVANTIEEAEGEVRDDYHARLNSQLLTAVIDGDVAGFNTELGVRIFNISRQYYELVRQGLDRHSIQQQIAAIITTEGLVDDYLDMIRENTSWGGNVELGILAEMLGIQIIVHRRDGQDMPTINQHENLPIIHLDYDGGHYNLILNYPDVVTLQEGMVANVTDDESEGVTSPELEENSLLLGLSIIVEEMGSINFF